MRRSTRRVMQTGWVAAVAMIACGCASSSSPPTSNGFSNTFDILRGKTPMSDVKKMEDSASPDHRREGIYDLVSKDFGQHEPYTKRYRQIAQSDSDFTVRAAAVRACNWSRDKSAVPVFIAALNDQSESVRWEAAKGLANVPDPSAIDPLIRAINSQTESRNVKIAATDALRHYRNLTAARALVSTLNGKDFGVAWQARHSLLAMTGADLRYDERAWLEYLTGAKKPVG